MGYNFGPFGSYGSAYGPQLQQLQNARDTVSQTYAGLSGQGLADINKNYDMAGMAAQSNLQSSGLGNTTVGATLSQGLARERSGAINRYNDSLAQQKLSYDIPLQQQMAAVMGQAGQKKAQQQQIPKPYYLTASGAKQYGYYHA